MRTNGLEPEVRNGEAILRLHRIPVAEPTEA